jgi:uncharacterized membrane protein YsdA (DUF1294 family)
MSSPLPYNRQNALASQVASDNASHIASKIVLTTGVTQGGIGAYFVEEIAKHKPQRTRSPQTLPAQKYKFAS